MCFYLPLPDSPVSCYTKTQRHPVHQGQARDYKVKEKLERFSGIWKTDQALFSQHNEKERGMEHLFLARPTKEQLDWADMELGLFIHWFPMGWYQDIDKGRVMDPAYQQELLARCTCDTLDTDQWAQSAVDLGAKYLVFVAKHALGFCAWQTDAGQFGMKQIPYRDGRGDVVADVARSCKKYGLKLGIYLAADTQVLNVGQQGIARDAGFQDEYDQIYRTWLYELLSRYGEVVEVWFDGSLRIEVGDILKRYAPRAMVFQSKYATIRWVGQEEGYASDPAWNSVERYDALTGIATQRHGTPEGQVWLPLECDARIRRDWGFHDNLDDNPLKSLDELMDMYYGAVGRGAVLLLNQAPHPKGHIIHEDMARMKEFGDEIRKRFSHPVAHTVGEGQQIILDLGAPTPIDHVVLMEDIRLGERVRAYQVDYEAGGQWQQVCAGIAIGHKKIDAFPEVTAARLRFTAKDSVGTPVLRSFAAYYAGKIPGARANTAPKEDLVCEWGAQIYDHRGKTIQLNISLTPFIKEAGQYTLTFRTAPGSQDALSIDEYSLEMGGIQQDDYCVRAGENRFSLYIPGISGSIVFKARSRYQNAPSFRGDAVLVREG